MSSPIGSGGTYTPGSPQDIAARQKAAAQSANPLAAAAGAVGSSLLAGPLTMIFGSLTASVYNTLNVILNSALYGIITAGGFIIMAFGLYSLSQDVPGMTGIGSGIVPVAKKAAKIVGLAALL